MAAAPESCGGRLGGGDAGLLLSGRAGTGAGWKLLVGGLLPQEGRPGSLGSCGASNFGSLGASAGAAAAGA